MSASTTSGGTTVRGAVWRKAQTSPPWRPASRSVARRSSRPTRGEAARRRVATGGNTVRSRASRRRAVRNSSAVMVSKSARCRRSLALAVSEASNSS